MSLETVNMPKYATVLNGGIGVLGTGASTVGATAIGIDGIAADAKVTYIAGAFGGIIESLMASTDDTAAVNVIVYLLDGTTVHPLGIVNVPLNSGNLGTVANVDILNGLVGLPVNTQSKKYIPMRAGMTLKVAVLAAMTANKSVWVKTTGVDYVA